MARLVQAAREAGIPHVASADDHELTDPEIVDDPDFANTFPPHCLRGTTGAEKIPETRAGGPAAARARSVSAGARARADRGSARDPAAKKNFGVFTEPERRAGPRRPRSRRGDPLRRRDRRVQRRGHPRAAPARAGACASSRTRRAGSTRRATRVHRCLARCRRRLHDVDEVLAVALSDAAARRACARARGGARVREVVQPGGGPPPATARGAAGPRARRRDRHGRGRRHRVARLGAAARRAAPDGRGGRRARAPPAARLFADDPDVHVLAGPWRDAPPAQAPFDLLFYDGGRKQFPEEEGEAVVELLAPGGTVVLDDFASVGRTTR